MCEHLHRQHLPSALRFRRVLAIALILLGARLVLGRLRSTCLLISCNEIPRCMECTWNHLRWVAIELP
jgi:hypothetical protein